MWRVKRVYRFLTGLSGPGLFWVFGALQAFVIARSIADLGWHWYPTWPVGIVVGYTPFLGAFAAAKLASDVGPIHFWPAFAFFLTPFWLFGLLTAVPLAFGPPTIRPLRLMRTPRPERVTGTGTPRGKRRHESRIAKRLKRLANWFSRAR